MDLFKDRMNESASDNNSSSDRFEGNNRTRKIFILPFDLKAKDINNKYISPGFIKSVAHEIQLKTGLNPFIEKKRSRIFNAELTQLIEKVKAKSEPKITIQENVSFIPEDSISNFKFFYKTFVEGKSKEGISGYILELLGKTEFNTFSINVLNPNSLCYEPLIHYNFDSIMSFNYMFDLNDKTFCYKEQEFETIHFDEELINNPFFKKKFSEDFIKKHQGVILSFKKYLDLSICISLFFHSDTKKHNQTISELLNEIETSLPGLYPAFRKLLEPKVVFDPKDMLDEVVSISKSFTHNGSRSCYFNRIFIMDPNIIESFYQKKEKLIKKVESLFDFDSGKIIDYLYSEILVLSIDNIHSEIKEKCLEVFGTKTIFQVRTLKYPEESRNIYLYF